MLGSLFYLTAGDLNAEEEDVVRDLNAKKEGETFGDFNVTRKTSSFRDSSPLRDLNASPEDRSDSRGELNAFRGDLNASRGDLNASRGDLNALRVLSAEAMSATGDFNATSTLVKAESVTSLAETQVQEQISFCLAINVTFF